jgi:uncharacterized protein HemY
LIGFAKCHEKKNEIEKAIEFAQKACEVDTENQNSIYYLGMLYMKQKNIKKA